MSRLLSTADYLLESYANIILDSLNIIMHSPSTFITGNLYIEGDITCRNYVKSNVEIFQNIICNTISTNSLLINGSITSNLVVDGAIYTNKINMPNGVLNIPNGTINGPVKIYGLQVMDLPVVSANKINFKSTANEKTYDFNIENIDTPPPDENCRPSWIKVKINGASFYIFAQMCED
jgi:hypothetical protein